MNKQTLINQFEKYIMKLRITPAWDVRLEFAEDPTWSKTGDFKIDCDDRKAIVLLNIVNPKQENLEEVIIHELMHIKSLPLLPYLMSYVSLALKLPEFSYLYQA